MRDSPRAIWNVRIKPVVVTRSGRNPVMSWSLKVMRPRSGGITPEMQLNSVVLPAPLGPIKPVMPRGSTVSDTPLSACTP